jgi:hypothetical protein
VLVREIIAIYSDNFTKAINTICMKNAELLNVKAGGIARTVTTIP